MTLWFVYASPSSMNTISFFPTLSLSLMFPPPIFYLLLSSFLNSPALSMGHPVILASILPQMLRCVVCCNVFHLFCMEEAYRSNLSQFTCPSCIFCHVCGKEAKTEASSMILLHPILPQASLTVTDTFTLSAPPFLFPYISYFFSIHTILLYSSFTSISLILSLPPPRSVFSVVTVTSTSIKAV